MATYNIDRINFKGDTYLLRDTTSGYSTGGSEGEGIQYIAGTGLIIEPPEEGSEQTASTINHSNSITAQTTQGLYPITYDSEGHITSSGSQITNISSFTNDVGYLTSADVPQGASAYSGTISAISTTANTGTNNSFARGDHVHNITGATIESALGYTPGISNLTLGNTSTTAAAGNHTHTYTEVGAQAPLVSGTNIKTINGVSLLGSGDLTITSGGTYTAGTGLALNGTEFKHSNSVTAKNTQAIYPITFDTQGHITGAGNAVTIPNITGKVDINASGSFSETSTINNNGDNILLKTEESYSHMVAGIKISSQPSQEESYSGVYIGAKYLNGSYDPFSDYNIAVESSDETSPAKRETIIKYLITPTSNTDAANKKYVDDHIPSAGSSATAVGSAAAAGSASTWSRSDHTHNLSITLNNNTYTPTNGVIDLGTISGGSGSGTIVSIVRW